MYMNKNMMYKTNNNWEAIKRIATFVVAIVFVLGCMWVPGPEFVEEGHAIEKIQGEYVDGEVIVSYVDTEDMNLSSRQEKKIENVLGNAEEIMTLEDVDLTDIDVDESKMVDEVQQDETVNETMAVVSSDAKSTSELVSEIEKLPNVDNVCPNYIFYAIGEETSSQNSEEEITEDIEPEEETTAVEAEETIEENSVETEEISEELIEQYTDDTGYQWAYNKKSNFGMNIPDWNNPSKKNANGTVVAILDTGIDYTHEDLDDVMWKDGKKYSELTGLGGGTYGIDNHVIERDGKYYMHTDSDPMDDNGYYENRYYTHSHGTHVAGIVAAEWNDFGVSGAANGTKLMAVKAGDSEGSFTVSSIAKGYNYIIKAADKTNVVAINNSWGGKADDSFGIEINKLVNQAGSKGIVSIFASGNECYDCDKGEYSCTYLKNNPYAVVVDAIDSYGKMASYSNYGRTTTDVGAPGVDIMSTVRNDSEVLEITGLEEPFDEKGGTSMAAPAVTGEVAILYAKHPKAPAEIIAAAVKNNTTANNSLKNKCKSGGQANVQKALSANMKALPEMALRSNSYTYDGKTKTNAVAKVTGIGGAQLKNGYQISGTLSAKLPGTYAITATPADAYYKAATKQYTINIKPTIISKLYRAKRAFTVKVAKQGKVYVNGYQVRYSLNKSMSGAKYKTIGTKYSRISKKVRSLKKKKTYYVQVRSYKTIGKTKYYSDWSGIKAVTTK